MAINQQTNLSVEELQLEQTSIHKIALQSQLDSLQLPFAATVLASKSNSLTDTAKTIKSEYHVIQNVENQTYLRYRQKKMQLLQRARSYNS